jgi:hypothetical protein
VSFAVITLCVSSQRVFIFFFCYFVIGSIRKLLDTSSYVPLWMVKLSIMTGKQYLTPFREQSPSEPSAHSATQELPWLLRKLKAHYHILMRSVTFRNMLVVRICLSSSQRPSWRTTLVSGLRLLIQYIHSYPPYLEAVSSIWNPGMCHAVVTETHLTWKILKWILGR